MYKHFRSRLTFFVPVVAHQLVIVVLPAPDASYWYVGLLTVLLNISTTILASSGVACNPLVPYLLLAFRGVRVVAVAVAFPDCTLPVV